MGPLARKAISIITQVENEKQEAQRKENIKHSKKNKSLAIWLRIFTYSLNVPRDSSITWVYIDWDGPGVVRRSLGSYEFNLHTRCWKYKWKAKLSEYSFLTCFYLFIMKEEMPA